MSLSSSVANWLIPVHFSLEGAPVELTIRQRRKKLQRTKLTYLPVRTLLSF
jgi:hypothetical protein